MEPFLKWAGGKRWLIHKIKNQMPAFKTYYEPFIGSGTLFFHLEPKSAVISDSNPELINCYRQIKNNCALVINILNGIKIDFNTYYNVRDKFNCETDKVKKAAYFIYLNKMCWNGLYRVNRAGKFNVPIGRNIVDGNRIFDSDQLFNASKLLKRAKLECCDFEETVKGVRNKSDFVYFDPPYITTHLNNGFIEYNSVLFQHADELRLSKLADKLARRGVKVMVSNAAHPLIKQQYNGIFFKSEIERASLIAGDVTKRSRFTELVVTSFPFSIEIEKTLLPRVKLDVIKYKPSYNPKCKM